MAAFLQMVRNDSTFLSLFLHFCLFLLSEVDCDAHLSTIFASRSECMALWDVIVGEIVGEIIIWSPVNLHRNEQRWQLQHRADPIVWLD